MIPIEEGYSFIIYNTNRDSVVVHIFFLRKSWPFDLTHFFV